MIVYNPELRGLLWEKADVLVGRVFGAVPTASESGAARDGIQFDKLW